MSYVFITYYKSNKAPSFHQADIANVEEVKARAETIMNSSVDISDVSVFEFIAMASKVETVQWN